MFHEIHTISDFEIVAPYTLRIRFNDDQVKTIDFRPMLRGELYGPLRGVNPFNQVRLDPEIGTLVRPNEADFNLISYKFNHCKKSKKRSRKDAEPQRRRKEKLCGFFAASRLCVRLFFWFRLVRLMVILKRKIKSTL